MTRVLGALEDLRYVERAPHPTDGRQAVVRLTAEGAAVVAAERRRRDAWLAKRLRDLSADELATLSDAAHILERLANS